MKPGRTISCIAAILLSFSATAAAEGDGGSFPISPAYFGPNAFPVPEMDFGKTSPHISLEVGPALFASRNFSLADEATATINYRLTLPLFTDRVNLRIWGEAMDWYRCSTEANAAKGVEGPSEGAWIGEVYLSTDIMVLRQEKHFVNAVIRAALKSAAGEQAHLRRYYDSPGYFFDATVGREIGLGKDMSLNIAASAGFLCWQTAVSAQNDAVMYGVAAAFNAGFFELKAHYGGYVGWQKNGDSPMSIRAETGFRIKMFTIRLKYQEGLKDWPYRQFAVGLETRFGMTGAKSVRNR